MSGSRQAGYYCYMLECADGTLYTGWTTDPARRLKEHNAGRGALYTRWRRPVELIYLEEIANRSAAQQRENHLKRLTRKKKLDLIQEFHAAERDSTPKD